MAGRLPHRPGLDQVRGAAVVAVVAYHLGYLQGGFLGVDVFFVLSGFLVTSLLLAETADDGGGHGGRIDLGAFWRARFRRLVPAVLVLVPTVLVAARLVRWPANRLDDLAVDGLATATWWENWRQILAGQSYWDPAPSPFRHAWSLAIEEQFYVLWPLVVVGLAALIARRAGSVRRVVGLVAAAGAALSAGAHLWAAHHVGAGDLSRVYLGTDTRVFAILVGCALACSPWGLVPRSDLDRGGAAGSGGARSTSVLDAGALLGTAVLVWMVVDVRVDDPALFRNGGFLTAAAAAALVVTAVATPGRSPVRSLATRSGVLLRTPAVVLRHLGLRSYGIYLWSWPIQVLAQHRWPDRAGWERSLGVVVVALVVAELSYRIVEHPIRRSAGWAAAPRRRRRAWALGIALPVITLVTVFQASEPDPVHEQLETDDALELARNQPTRPPSTAGDPGETPDPPGLHILIIGDSVSFTIGYYKPGMYDAPAGIDWIDSRAIIGCGLLAAEGWEFPGEGAELGPAAGGDCVIQADVEEQGLAEEPDVVVVFPGAWESFIVRSPDGETVQPMTDRMAEVLTENLVRRALAAHEVGATFIVVGWACPSDDTPAFRRRPEFIEWFDAVMRGAMASAADDHGVDARYLAPDDQVCEGGITGEPTEAKSTWMGDSNHVVDQESGERLWHEWLGPLLVDEMAG